MADTAKQKALSALLDSSTLTEAAKKAGINRKTLYNYIHTDIDFARAYEEAQAQIVIAQLEDMSEARNQAREVIAGIMRDEQQPAAIRLKAAQSVFNIAEAQQKRAEAITADSLQRNAPLFEPFR
jgi:dTDP-4-amino-4,6-dideoxygalactose transaminase